MQSTGRTEQPEALESSEETASARGLKIPVSAVRFRPWAPVETENTAESNREVLGDSLRCAELQSSGRPRARRESRSLPTLEWLRAQTVDVPCPSLGTPCWAWQRNKNSDGYAKITIAGRDTSPHRLAYELVHGPIHCWLILDHLCRRRDCINPEHGEPVTQTENTLRGEAPTAVAHRTGVCKLGHPLSPVAGRWRCKVCLAQRQRESYQRKKAQRAEGGAP